MYRTELVDRKWITVVSRYLVFYSCGILLQAVPVEGQEQMAVRDLEFRTIREDLGSLADGGKAGRYIDDGEGRLKANVDGRGLGALRHGRRLREPQGVAAVDLDHRGRVIGGDLHLALRGATAP